MHPWHDSYVDDTLIATAFPVVIEIPKGSTNKYELDKETGLLRLDRVLVQRGLLSGRLRLHPAHVLRRRRPARRAGARPGAGVPADDRRGARDRRDADARREGDRRQDRRGQRARSGVRRLHRQGAAAAARAARAAALLRGLQGARAQAGASSKTCSGPTEAIAIITEALELYRKLRRGELAKGGKI